MVNSNSSQSNIERLKVTDKSIKALLGPYDMRWLKWDPISFALESTRLENKLIDSSVQIKSLEAFRENPKRAMTYIVSGNPDDKEARYFAGYLAQLHSEGLGINADVRWETIVGNFENPGLREEPTMLVITNLTPRSSNLKYEKTRDLIERHSSIPKVIVVAGEDPLSFAATRLYTPCHALAYFGAKISKTLNEVI